ncbi:thiamine diphosphokinase [Brevibacillus dissolubilis]|uniref:thiamine diphosphokinase n=1 Tax=Brevibacillus dissolubilis TaxID=1844116 RepID=UPI0011174736|nr:thiamine diphosphokinase [Brevibacillus dissolubilis]
MTTVHICTGGLLDVWPDLKAGDKLIGVDAGALRLLEAGYRPDVAVGDFDTIGEAGVERLLEAGITLEQFPAAKDATDTEIALETALGYQPTGIKVYGAIGSRMDHTLANLQLLWKAHSQGVWMEIINRQNHVRLLSERFTGCVVERGEYEFFSLIPVSAEVTGITLTGFLYPLQEAVITLGSSLGVSNQLLGERGRVEIKSGAVYLIASCDLV